MLFVWVCDPFVVLAFISFSSLNIFFFSIFCLGYDIRVDGPSVIRHSSIIHESSKSLLLDGDWRLLSDFPLEALHDMAVHNAESICASLFCCVHFNISFVPLTTSFVSCFMFVPSCNM